MRVVITRGFYILNLLFSTQLIEPPPILVKPKFQAVSAVKDRVVERERGNSASGEATKKPVTQVLSRFRATRVHQ